MGKLFLVVVFVLNLLFGNVLYSQTNSLNSDFELGNLTGWSASNGKRNKTTGAITFSNNSILNNREMIISNLYYDRNTCFQLPSIPPDGGNFVAKLGNNVKGAEAEQLRYTITVDETNTLFIYKYAVVFEDPGHLDVEQPYFELAVKDMYGNIIDLVCGYNKIISSGAIEGFNTCNLGLDTVVRWKPWTTVALDLTPYIGQTIQLEFTNADCSLGGHWAYSYMEARTGELGIQVKACESDSVALMSAPEGFTSYLWSTGETTREIIVQKPQNGAKYTCSMTSSPQCSVTLTATMQIETVNVEPADVTICKGASVTLTAKGADFYEWSNGLGIGAVKTVFPTETIQYTVKGVSKSGCIDEGITKVTVIDVPAIVLSANSPCENLPLNFSAHPSGLVSYEWKGPNAFSSNLQNPSISQTTLGMAGTYTMIATNALGCKLEKSINVSVLPIPELIVTGNNVCDGGEFYIKSFPAQLKSYLWSGPNNFSANTQNITQSQATPLMSGTYTLKAVDLNLCENTKSVTVTVFPNPKAIFENDTVCVGLETHFVNNSVAATAWEWNFGNGISSQVQNPTGIFYPDSYSYPVTLKVFNEFSCSNSITKNVHSFAVPVARFLTDKACIGDNYKLADMSYVNNDNISSWNWNLGTLGSSTLQSPNIQLVDATPIPVSLTVSTQHCSHVRLDTIFSFPKPIVSSIQFSGCAPLDVQFSSLTQARVFYAWDFGDGETSPESDPLHFFFNELATPKDFNVKQTITTINGCSDSAFSKITVFPQPIANFSISKNKVCSGELVSFTNLSENSGSYSWKVGTESLSTNKNFSYTFINETDKIKYIPITLKTTNSYFCVDSVVRFVSVYPFPKKGIELSDSAGCSPAIIQLSTQSLATDYEWSLGDGTVELGSNFIEHIFVNEGTQTIIYPITLKVSTNQGCAATFTSQVYVYPSPHASFTIDTNIACSPFQSQIRNTSTGETSYSWSFDGEMGVHNGKQSFSHLFENKTQTQQSHRIEILVANNFGCTSKHSLSVNVFPEVVAQFTANPVEGCSPLDVSFVNTSIGANSYYWTYGDGTNSSNVDTKHTYVNISDSIQKSGVQLVAISAYNCIDTSEISKITVFPQPLSMFNADTISGCSPIVVTLTDNSKGETSSFWNYGDGSTSSQLLPKHTFSNAENEVVVYPISLITYNNYGCIDTSLQPITVYPQVFPNFIPNISGCSPLPITFANLSKNAEMYVWDFGDGKKSTVVDPKNTFINESLRDTIFHVNLTATTHLGCKASISKDIEVFATPNPTFIPSASQVRVPNTMVTFTNETKGQWNYEWDFGDGYRTTQIQPDVHSFAGTGTYPVILKAQGLYCEDTVIHYIVVTGADIVADYDSSVVGCVPLTVSFNNKSLYATEYNWDFGDGTTSAEQHPTHIFTTPGTYVIELTAINNGSSDVSRAHTVTVFSNPTAAFVIAPEVVYLPKAQIATYNQSTDAEISRWYFGDGTISNEFQPMHSYIAEGFYDIALAVESRDGCKDSIMVKKAAEVLLDCGLKFPNAFTPIGTESKGYYDASVPETTNDIFHPIFMNIIDYELQIFNRWGELVFESIELQKGWDGFYKGSISKSDVYVWKCEATCLGGKNIELIGNLTLIR